MVRSIHECSSHTDQSTDFNRHGLRLIQFCLLPRRSELSGRIRSQGGREWRHSYWNKMQRWRCSRPRETHHEQTTQAWSKQANSNCRSKYGSRKQNHFRQTFPPRWKLCDATSNRFLQLGLLWTSSRRPPFRISRPRRSSSVASTLQSPNPYLRPRKPHGQLRPDVHLILECTTVRSYCYSGRMGF